ncbi:alkyl hydroperoxide reductase/ Thiol specific antioxidant/ Mal allergen [Lacinutrix sp. 5H-3-7-4]|nr:alkyl hydroperoxide reductase/ Thiol specific antioxidant/ Mal allergen [Lacinutrix sp. 5H-3-7-4]
MLFCYYFYTMKTYLIIIVLIFSGCKSDVKKKDALADDYTVVLEVYNFNELEPLLTKNDGKIYVVNFWATWCAPCVKELPYFEDLNKTYKSKNVEVLLVSLDFPNQYENRLKPFIKKHRLQSKVVALNDVDSNTWIPKIDKDWSGAIPATIIYNSEDSKFYERSFTYKELEEEVNKFLK